MAATQFVSDEDLLAHCMVKVEHSLSLIRPGTLKQERLALLQEGRNFIARSEEEQSIFVYCPDAGDQPQPHADRR